MLVYQCCMRLNEACCTSDLFLWSVGHLLHKTSLMNHEDVMLLGHPTGDMFHPIAILFFPVLKTQGVQCATSLLNAQCGYSFLVSFE